MGEYPTGKKDYVDVVAMALVMSFIYLCKSADQ